ncbi:L-seryl-tRNA(Sec) selenium transferase [Anaeromyxobacter diazotrophicus]|nr:L-seryl-tRNA(Sec) selenium transferase [Anaeromyxobacter diazotrophicus]
MTPDKDTGPAAQVRRIPKADRLLAAAAEAGLVARLGHAQVMEAVRGALDEVRARVLAGEPCPPAEVLEAEVLARLSEAARGSLRRVVNATGVVIHTNLGRAPLSDDALAAMRAVGEGYSNLEYDLEAGERGDRYGHAAAALCRLTGAEAAVVVNNNASSVLIALAALCFGEGPDRGAPTLSPALPLSEGEGGGARGAGRGEQASLPEVVISRGQLVEIGGGFRIPDVLRRSGAALVEVGSTNRTYLRDFEAAATPRTRMLLSVHRSNFRLSGFVHDAELAELVALGRRLGVWVLDDLGSGTLLPTERFGLGREPTVQERVAAGADLVCFSGDKLLGGPQAGILVGRREAVERVKRHPLMRALRVDKLTLAALSATLAHYERGEAEERVPVWRAIAQPPAALEARARGWLVALGDLAPGATVKESTSAVGGGSLPEVTLPTRVLALPSRAPDALAARLRRGDPAVVGRIEEGALVLDPRAVAPGEDELLVRAVRAALAAGT